MKRILPILLSCLLMAACALPAFSAPRQPLVTQIRIGNTPVWGHFSPCSKKVTYYGGKPDQYLDALALALCLNSKDTPQRNIALARNSYGLMAALSDLVASGKIDTISTGGTDYVFHREDGRCTELEAQDDIPYFLCKLTYDKEGNVTELLDASIPTQVFYKDGKVVEINPGYKSNKLIYQNGKLSESLHYRYLYDSAGKLNYIARRDMTDDPDMVYGVRYNEDGTVQQFYFRGTLYEFQYQSI